MKINHLIWVTGLFLIGSACKDNKQILGNQVAGNWAVERLRFANPNRPGTDSTITPQGAVMTFNSCTYNSNSDLTDCPGTYQLVGFGKTTFTFKPYNNVVFINTLNGRDKTDITLQGEYATQFGDEGKRLELKGAMTYYEGSGKNSFSDQTAYITLVRQ